MNATRTPSYGGMLVNLSPWWVWDGWHFHNSEKRINMLKGKRKTLNDDPAGQIATITAAYGGIVPTKPLPRQCHRQVGWKELEDGSCYIAKLTNKKLYHFKVKAIPQNIKVVSDSINACGWLSGNYHKTISLPVLKQAISTGAAVPVVSLAESQRGFIFSHDKQKDSWGSVQVRPDGIIRKSSYSRPKLENKDYPGIFVSASSIITCISFLRSAFKLNVTPDILQKAFNNLTAVPKLVRDIKKC